MSTTTCKHHVSLVCIFTPTALCRREHEAAKRRHISDSSDVPWATNVGIRGGSRSPRREFSTAGGSAKHRATYRNNPQFILSAPSEDGAESAEVQLVLSQADARFSHAKP